MCVCVEGGTHRLCASSRLISHFCFMGRYVLPPVLPTLLPPAALGVPVYVDADVKEGLPTDVGVEVGAEGGGRAACELLLLLLL